MLDNGQSSLQDDFELMQLTEGDDPSLRAKDLIDPWENNYVLINPGEENLDFDIVSYGADGLSGGEGENTDIIN